MMEETLPEDGERLEILKALCNSLRTITPANGYLHDLSNDDGVEKVFRGRLVYGETDPLPMLSVLEPPIPLETFVANALDNTVIAGQWEIMVQGFVEDDDDNPTDPAHRLMADVKRCLGIERRRNKGQGDMDIFGLDGKVFQLDIGQGTVRPPDDFSTKAFFWLLVTLKIHEETVKE